MLQLSEVALNLGFLSVKFKVEELDETLGSLVAEMRAIAGTLGESERKKLREIMAAPTDTLTVAAVFPDFSRETPAHETLRKLRDAQFIRPTERGRWESRKHISVKPFGRLMWEKVGEEKLFGA